MDFPWFIKKEVFPSFCVVKNSKEFYAFINDIRIAASNNIIISRVILVEIPSIFFLMTNAIKRKSMVLQELIVICIVNPHPYSTRTALIAEIRFT